MNLDQLQNLLGLDELEEPPLVQASTAPDRRPAPEKTSSDSVVEKMGEIEMAQRLGYLLCRCSWPPQIMILTGSDFIYRCPRCKRMRDL